jgi:hypothetical protein
MAHLLVDRRRLKTLPSPEKTRRLRILEWAFAKIFSLGLGIAGSGVDDFGNVLPGGILAVRFSGLKESQKKTGRHGDRDGVR